MNFWKKKLIRGRDLKIKKTSKNGLFVEKNCFVVRVLKTKKNKNPSENGLF